MAARPIDTTGDKKAEARWQALVDEVIAAKANAAEARAALIAAEHDRGPVHLASPDALDAVASARQAYEEAGRRVEAASKAMKAGKI
jgi:hypothetical protein